MRADDVPLTPELQSNLEKVKNTSDERIGRLEQRIGSAVMTVGRDFAQSVATLPDRERRALYFVLVGEVELLLHHFCLVARKLKESGDESQPNED